MTIYNQFIDGLASGRPPDPDRVGEVCAELRKDLQRELGRRHLWTASPRLVGVQDHTWNDDALAEPAHDAYDHSFVRRLRWARRWRSRRRSTRRRSTWWWSADRWVGPP